MKGYHAIIIAILLSSCSFFSSEQSTEVQNEVEDWTSKPIVRNNAHISPLRPNEFNPNIPDTISPEKKKVLKEILDNMIYVEGGSFFMGDTIGNPDETQTNIPQFKENVYSFYLGKYEVTQREWMTLMGETPVNYPDPDRPMENFTWVDGNIFITELKELTGLPFRYPTEEEWEYAAKDGKFYLSHVEPEENEAEQYIWDIYSFKGT